MTLSGRNAAPDTARWKRSRPSRYGSIHAATGSTRPRGRTHAATASSASAHSRRRPAEQRRAVGRALLDGDALERQLEDGGDDLQPQLAARAAARDAADRSGRSPSSATRSSESRSP